MKTSKLKIEINVEALESIFLEYLHYEVYLIICCISLKTYTFFTSVPWWLSKLLLYLSS